MACRRVAAVARRTDIFDISRYAVPSALDGRPLASILGTAGSGDVGGFAEAVLLRRRYAVMKEAARARRR